MAYSPISSHILDAALTNPNVEFKWRRKLLMAFMGHYLELAQDKLGSRVADTIWDKAADGFTKVSSCNLLDRSALTDLPFNHRKRSLVRSSTTTTLCRNRNTANTLPESSIYHCCNDGRRNGRNFNSALFITSLDRGFRTRKDRRRIPDSTVSRTARRTTQRRKSPRSERARRTTRRQSLMISLRM
jgi:hypothetical protein